VRMLGSRITMAATLALLVEAAASPTAIAMEEAIVLKPSSPWNLDYSDDSCALRRDFAAGAELVSFELRQFAPGDGFNVIVASKAQGFRERAPKVRFLPDAKFRTIERPIYLDYGNGARGVQWGGSFFDETFANKQTTKPGDRDAASASPSRRQSEYKQRESSISGLEIGGSFSPSIVLATGEMHRPMEGMRKCIDELVTHWGIDPATQRTLSRRASPTGQATWARKLQDAYPEAMLKQEKSGIVRVRMIVGPDGKPTSCRVQVKSQDPSFETTACREMMKVARFEPALDAVGKPVASYFITSVIYVAN
jgi:TonB family protein